MISRFVQEYQYKGSIMIQFWTAKIDTLFMQSGKEKETEKHMDTNEQRKVRCCYNVAQRPEFIRHSFQNTE